MTNNKVYRVEFEGYENGYARVIMTDGDYQQTVFTGPLFECRAKCNQLNAAARPASSAK